MTRELEQLFDAKASSLLGTFLAGSGSSGFRIPVYQRAYTWDISHIARLFQDISSGIEVIARTNSKGKKASQGFRFLGTIIFVDEGRNKEPGFDGNSLEVVDGQQRLTTLALLACRCCENVRKTQARLRQDTEAHQWLRTELRTAQKNILKALAIKDDMQSGPNAYVPRIVREDQDDRATTRKPVYRSLIATYIHDFVVHGYDSLDKRWNFGFGGGKEAVYFEERVKLIEKKVDEAEVCSEENFSWQALSPLEVLENDNLRALFQTEIPQDAFVELKKSLSENGSTDENVAVNLLMFSNFLLNRVVLTRVVVQDREYAYDIFEALNTSGEPLTALETFKPVLVRKFGDHWSSSEVSEKFNEVEEWVNSAKNNTEQKRRSQDIVIDARVYTEGQKLSRHLRDQRDFLRSAVERLQRKDGIQVFTQTLALLKEYRHSFWNQKNIPNNLTDPALKERSAVAAVLVLIKASGTSLANPILCRYWDYSVRIGNAVIFSDAVKALGAFIVFRRSVTTTTANIDRDFRRLMQSGSLEGNQPIGTGLDPWRDNPPDVGVLKEHLRGYLAQKKISIDSKTAWVSRVVHLPLYETSKDIAKFILLAATHDSVVDNEKKYFLKKGKPNSNPMLSYEGWYHDVCETIEHIAPQNPKSMSDWDSKIYEDPAVRHTLGNLILVPRAENNELANAAWSKKRLYFEAFSCNDPEKVDGIIERAKVNHAPFSNRAIALLKSGAFNPMAAPLRDLEVFDYQALTARSENIAALAWEELSDWIGF